jgi:indole-3-glycerol phosphate synthase
VSRMNVLERIVASTRADVARRRDGRPLAEVRDAAADAAAERADRGDHRDFRAALARPGLSVIAEHKRRSPSAGAIREDLFLEDVVAAYERGGAAALSVLTEGPNFGGTVSDLITARAAARLPILRKDFIVDPYQVHEALLAGADAILLIVAALPAPDLFDLAELAAEVGLDALIEVHDEQELEVAAELETPIIGINNRDLTTLVVDTRRAFELRPSVPVGALCVAESGFRQRAELDELSAAGIDAVLIGEALMRQPDIEAACRALTGAGVGRAV